MTLPLLIPLEWPIQHPSAIVYILLLVLGPLAIGGIITVIGLAPTWRRSLDRNQSSSEVVRSHS